ncbi:MAG: hypothetical protein COA74_02470 [Gammaproteobacteria bacterium]|nr:MAG: hypothetical protein COA74_02470 [Gammaproteobacteria bacterium]
MPRLIESEIATLIDQSNDIAMHVRQEHWDRVEQLTEIRQLALEDFFNLPIPKQSIGLIEKMIRKIMAIDHGLVEFIEQEKKSTFRKFANLQNNNKAKLTYQNVATLHLP